MKLSLEVYGGREFYGKGKPGRGQSEEDQVQEELGRGDKKSELKEVGVGEGTYLKDLPETWDGEDSRKAMRLTPPEKENY